MVAQPYRNDPSYPLKEWDVITQIGDTPIDSDGKVAIRYDLRLSASYLVQKYRQEWRAADHGVSRRQIAFAVDLTGGTQRELVIPYLLEAQPDFLFLDRSFFANDPRLSRTVGQSAADVLRLSAESAGHAAFDKPAFENEELVVVASPLFPDRITKGYDDPNRAVLSEVNGIKVKNLRHLVEFLRDNRDEQISFKFASVGVLTHETMVFNRTDLMNATGKILEENGIRYPYSPDLRAVWEAPPAGERPARRPNQLLPARAVDPLIDRTQRERAHGATDRCSANMKVAEQQCFTSSGFC